MTIEAELTEEILEVVQVADWPQGMAPDHEHHRVLCHDDRDSTLGDVEGGVDEAHVESVPGPRVGQRREVELLGGLQVTQQVAERSLVELVAGVEEDVAAGQASVVFDYVVRAMKHVQIEELTES